MVDVMTGILLAAGVIMMLIAAVGLLRLPDPLCRAHAVAKAVSLGIALILLGTWVKLGDTGSGLKLALAILFQLGTIPVASHLLAQAAYHLEIPRWRQRPVARLVREDSEGRPDEPVTGSGRG